MKKNALVLGLGLSLSFFIACNKKEAPGTDTQLKTPVTSPSVTDYFPLAAGDYWVYKQSFYDTNGNSIPQTWKNDSVVIKNDTVINSKNYRIVADYNYLGRTTPVINYYRDSSDCIVGDNGNIIFSTNASGAIYKYILSSDTIAYVNYTYNEAPTNVTVPLGTYSCVDFKGDVYRKADNYSKAYLVHKYYCKNIGPVKKTELFVNSLYRLNFELLSYHVQ